ncbi:HAUS augmin-like complex subunit 8 [Choloepus didactylus]|uniref:HAUS augmin-like complex subunit 8 n=1 Tax=Choloepus didactylus TaxID=27675 RepID=UPI00189C604A|nr:HAUS augmin-like complex subunit 8 [Choloepus didactylus]
MADTSGRGVGKPPAADPNTPSGAKPRGRRGQGGRVVESRYLQYERKTAKKAPATDVAKASGKMPEGGRKPSSLQKSRDDSGLRKGDLQSTLLEGHGTAPPDLDLSAINDKSTLRKTPQLEKTLLKKTESNSFSALRKKSPDLPESMEMMESQTLLLTLLTVKIESGLARLEERAEGALLALCREREKLQEKAHELRRSLLLSRKKRELTEVLDAQIEILSPFEAVAGPFQERYRSFAAALDTTRHELPVSSIHLAGDGPQFLDDLQHELATTHRILGELGPSSSEDNLRALDLLSELKEITVKKDLELRRSFAQVLELSAEASKEAALVNQDAWEEVQGSAASSRWYFQREGIGEAPPGEPPGTPFSVGDGLRTP